MRDSFGIDLTAQPELLPQSRALVVSPIHLWLTALLAGRPFNCERDRLYHDTLVICVAV